MWDALVNVLMPSTLNAYLHKKTNKKKVLTFSFAVVLSWTKRGQKWCALIKICTDNKSKVLLSYQWHKNVSLGSNLKLSASKCFTAEEKYTVNTFPGFISLSHSNSHFEHCPLYFKYFLWSSEMSIWCLSVCHCSLKMVTPCLTIMLA